MKRRMMWGVKRGDRIAGFTSNKATAVLAAMLFGGGDVVRVAVYS